MPAELYTRWSMTQNFIGLNLNKKNPETSRTWLSHISKEKDLNVELRVSTPQELKKKIYCFKVDCFCALCNTVFKAMGCFFHYCPCQEARFSLTEEDIERGNKKREMDQIIKQYIKKTVIILLKSGKVIGGISIKRQRVLKNI